MLSDIPEYDVVNHVPMTRFDGVAGAKLYLVNTLAEWRAFFDMLMKQKLVACDTETSGFDYFKDDRICGLSFGWRDTHFYIPLRHLESVQDGSPPPQISMDAIRDDLRTFFAQDDVFTVWHNWKFDAHFYRADGIEIRTPFHDTRILWQLFDENAPGALKIIASGWRDMLGRWHKGLVDPKANAKEKLIDMWRANEARARRKKFFEDLEGIIDKLSMLPENQSLGRRELKKLAARTDEAAASQYAKHSKSDVHYGYVPVKLMCEYAGLDTFFTWKVYEHVMNNMTFSQRLFDLYINEIKLSRVLMEAEEAGVLIDRDYLVSLGETYDSDAERLENEIRSTLGVPDLNLNSNQQLADALQNYGITLTKKTASGNYSVDAKVLKKLSKQHDVVSKILDLRTIKKLKGTYVEGILSKLTDDNILHCSFNQNVSTGRMSSTNPNLQNIPGRDDSIRRAFINPGKDWVYLLIDYSQVEVRLTADYSRDPLLLDTYAKNQDVHTRTMCEMFSYDYDEVVEALGDSAESHPLYKTWKALRTVAKRINFGIIYGVGAPGLSEQIPRPDEYLDASQEEWVSACQDYIDQYLDKYRGVRKFIRAGSRTVARDCFVENKFGRIRHLPHAKATKILRDKTKFWLEARAKRQGVNFLVQGTAADLFKIAAVRVHEILQGKKSHIVNFVHDEIQIYAHVSELDEILPKVKAAMEDFDFAVPIIADVDYTTTNWADKQAL